MLSRNVTAYQIWKDTKIPQSSIGKWKIGLAIPSMDNLKKLAEYFNVTVDYLLGKEDKKNKPTDYDELKMKILKFMEAQPKEAQQWLVDQAEMFEAAQRNRSKK